MERVRVSIFVLWLAIAKSLFCHRSLSPSLKNPHHTHSLTFISFCRCAVAQFVCARVCFDFSTSIFNCCLPWFSHIFHALTHGHQLDYVIEKYDCKRNHLQCLWCCNLPNQPNRFVDEHEVSWCTPICLLQWETKRLVVATRSRIDLFICQLNPRALHPHAKPIQMPWKLNEQKPIKLANISILVDCCTSM